MPKFYGTFGGGQTFGYRSVVIEAKNMNMAREAMFATFGNKFCTVYADEYEKSEFFQPPVIGLEAIHPEYDNLEVQCTALFPNNIVTKWDKDASR